MNNNNISREKKIRVEKNIVVFKSFQNHVVQFCDELSKSYLYLPRYLPKRTLCIYYVLILDMYTFKEKKGRRNFLYFLDPMGFVPTISA